MSSVSFARPLPEPIAFLLRLIFQVFRMLRSRLRLERLRRFRRGRGRLQHKLHQCQQALTLERLGEYGDDTAAVGAERQIINGVGRT